MLTYGKTILSIVFGLCVITCDMDMGLGEEVDLTAPTMTVTRVVLPNGDIHDITKDGTKLFLGPGVLVGTGFTLEGESSDNVNVGRIKVEDTGASESASAVSWETTAIGNRNANGIQNWSIQLDKIERGERTIRITAYDHVGNTGPDSVQQLTLLVDTNPPFVQNVTIERPSGQRVLPQEFNTLRDKDANVFTNIDYFQNESFTINAEVTHDFEVADVALNLWYIDTEPDTEPVIIKGTRPLITALSNQSGNAYAPSWHVTAEELIAAGQKLDLNLASGRHYLQLEITATARAGHSGNYSDTLSNLAYDLCWYPETDTPRITLSDTASGDSVITQAGIPVLVSVSDDDNIGELYAKMIPLADWNTITGSDDTAKLAWYKTNTNYLTLSNPSLQDKTSRTAVIPVASGTTHGAYRLVVLARDTKTNAINDPAGVWSDGIATLVQVKEDGIPVITIESPAASSRPKLENETFTIEGLVYDVELADNIVVTMAWVPDGDTAKGEAALKTALAENKEDGFTDGVKIRKVSLSAVEDYGQYKKRVFTIPLNLTYFTADGETQARNETKLLIFHTQSKNNDDVFSYLSLQAYTTPPVITLDKPVLDPESGNIIYAVPGELIPFAVNINSPDGIPLKEVLFDATPLEEQNGLYETTLTAPSDLGFYPHTVTAEDILGNNKRLDIKLNVTAWPKLTKISAAAPSGTTFSSGETIIVRAVFERPVTIKLPETDEKPTLTLENITNNGSSVTRDAVYQAGSGTSSLDFAYIVQPGDSSPELSVTALHMHGTSVQADIGSDPIPADSAVALSSVPTDYSLKIDAVAPQIIGIKIDTTDTDKLLKERETLTVEVITDKEIMVLGTPVLVLKTDQGSELEAAYQSTGPDKKSIKFSYTVKKENNGKVQYSGPDSFTSTSLAMITGTVGFEKRNELSLGNPTIQGDVFIDTAPPGPPIVTKGTIDSQKGQFVIEKNSIELNVQKVEFTGNDGNSWIKVEAGHDWSGSFEFEISGDGDHHVSARQYDQAGNVSAEFAPPHTFTLGERCDLISLTCDKADRAYTDGTTIQFTLNFNGNVTALSGNSGPSITIGHSDGSGKGTDKTLTLDSPVNTAQNFLAFTFTILNSEDLEWQPLIVKNINLQNVKWEKVDSTTADLPAGTTDPANLNSVANNYNNEHAITVLTTKPTITHINGNVVTTKDGVLAPISGTSALKLTFDRPVTAAQGKTITVRPASGWHIPPVLSNEDFIGITNAIDSTGKAELEEAYHRTTHGLDMSGTTAIPDTTTKYVLDFYKGLDDTQVKTHLESAKYLWTEIGVKDYRVIISNNEVTVSMPQLPNGRKWTIVIDADAFSDGAGNTFAGWSYADDNTFWSAKTETPVIRVNRVSNDVAIATDFRGKEATKDQPATPATPGTFVRYRIDCETPGANIEYITVPGGTRYKDESMLNDANVSEVTGEIPTTSYPDTAHNTDPDSLGGVLLPMGEKDTGDNSLYTARKDYIVARASLSSPSLDDSDKGYEGVFKTVLVYRNVYFNVDNIISNNPTDPLLYIHVAGSNVNGPPPTISGFPLGIDYTHRPTNNNTDYQSKFLYKHSNDDHIWITWEIVCDYYQMGAKTKYSSHDQAVSGNITYGNKELLSRSYGNYGMWVSDDNHKF